MSDLFIGLVMLVTLNNPPGAQLRGRVSSVIAGKSLTLQDVRLPHNGNWIDEITIHAGDIIDLQESQDGKQAPLTPPLPPSTQLPQTSVKIPPPRTFDDPAIVSMSQTPQVPNSSPSPIELPTVSGPRRPSVVSVEHFERDLTPAAVLVDPMSELSVGGHEQPILRDVINIKAAKDDISNKKNRRRRTKRGGRQADADIEDHTHAAVVGETKRGKGWRQTPLLEPNPSFQPFSTLKRRGRKQEHENGWATEDATDVQELGDFDFEMNLSKFDKKTVFNDIKSTDVISDGDRLIGHNRLPKSATKSGKNLLPTENVLNSTVESTWKSEADSDVEVGSKIPDSRSFRESRRPESKLRRPLSRKGSSVNPPSSRGPTPGWGPVPTQSGFCVSSTNRRCEVVSSLQMLNVENIANNEFGLTEDMMTENSARGIAQVALNASREKRRNSQTVPNSSLKIIVFAGNNKSGQRAIAAGRHLMNHGIDILLCVLGLDREAELLEGLRRQLKVFRNFGGRIVSKAELIDSVNTLEVPLIVDGLLGLTMSFEELRTGDQTCAYELIKWANRSDALVLAIDIPSGLDPASGKVAIIDGSPLYTFANYIISMGAPKKGLLDAMVGGGIPESRDWELFVTDIGIAHQAWKKAGTRIRRGTEFGEKWVIQIKLQVKAE